MGHHPAAGTIAGGSGISISPATWFMVFIGIAIIGLIIYYYMKRE